jgi:hypothetical protein
MKSARDIASFVAQILNLLHRRFEIGQASENPGAPDTRAVRRIQFCDTADLKSALQGKS